MMITCCMFLTMVATVLFVSEVNKENYNPAKLIIYALNVLALAYLFNSMG